MVANTLAVMVVNTRRKVGDFVKNVDTMELSGAVAIFRGVTMGNLSSKHHSAGYVAFIEKCVAN